MLLAAITFGGWIIAGQTIGFALKNSGDIKEILEDDEFIRHLIQ